jgi:hypothetical protein
VTKLACALFIKRVCNEDYCDFIDNEECNFIDDNSIVKSESAPIFPRMIDLIARPVVHLLLLRTS